MIVKDLERTYPFATGREMQRAMVEGSPHLHERKSWHIADDIRRTVRMAWESLGREPEPWMRAEGDREGSQGRGGAASALRATFRPSEAGRNAATLDADRGAATGAGHAGAGAWRGSACR